jgi:hypothetical protein
VSAGASPDKASAATQRKGKLPRLLKRRRAERRLGLELHVLGHATRFPPVSLVVVKPGIGQKQAAVGQGTVGAV